MEWLKIKKIKSEFNELGELLALFTSIANKNRY